ncbi:MAG: hypothetical protein HOJ34_10300 [Kordiimonadaceae bacterium]|jgi:hypothetical protein|nr:hypothetical protein [Kordiimonadaceae bacterium]
MKNLQYALWPVLILLPESLKAQSTELYPQAEVGSVGLFGGTGLLEMRNARFSNDGELAIGVGQAGGGQNYYATWQATPWLETTLRFSDYNKPSDGIDKGLDIKLRLLEEGKNNPAIAIGLQDMLGDGLFSGEYIVASKRINDFDITAGFGFGSMANRSRLNNISRIFGSSFETRSFSDPGSEKFRFGNYFAGEKMGFFWGIEYKTPVEGLTAKVEYSTVDKSKIAIFEDYKSKTAFNFGLNYKVEKWLEVGAGLQHGNQFAIHFTLKQNMHSPKRLTFAKGPAVDEIRSRQLKNTATSVTDYKGTTDQDIIFERLRLMGYVISSINLSEGHIELEVEPNANAEYSEMATLGAVLENYTEATINFPGRELHASKSDELGKQASDEFRATAINSREREFAEINAQDKALISKSIFDRMQNKKLKPGKILVKENEIIVTKNVAPFDNISRNIGRTVRILSNEAPDNVERFTVVSKESDISLSQVSVLRKDFENIANFNSSPEEILANATIEEPSITLENEPSYETFPKFEYGVLPDVEGHFGSDKNDHFKADLNLKIFGRIDIASGLQLYGEAKQHLIGNIDKIPGSTNPNIHHVRSDIGKYAAEGTTSIRRISLEYIKSPVNDFYTRLTAGHLEAMYSGISGELLYKPHDATFAFGLDMNFVKQRGFDQLLSMRGFKTVTGHASLYYVNKKYDITSKVSIGRYLAKDWGTTIDIYRQFRNGIRIGANATFTDMSDSDFGRGSFDKGIYMTIPFDFFWYKQSRDKARFNFRRLGKNGGQKINHNTDLFDLMSAGQSYRITNGWDRIID